MELAIDALSTAGVAVVNGSSLFDALVTSLDEGVKEREESRADAKRARDTLKRIDAGHKDTVPSSSRREMRRLRALFYDRLSAFIEEPGDDRLVSSRQAYIAWQKEKIALQPAIVASEGVSHGGFFGPAFMEYGLKPPTSPKAARIMGGRWPDKNPRPSRQQRTAASERRRIERHWASLMAATPERLEYLLDQDLINDLVYDQVTEAHRLPLSRKIDKRYFYNGGGGFCESSRTRAVQAKPDKKKKKKGRNNAAGQGGNRGGR